MRYSIEPRERRYVNIEIKQLFYVFCRKFR